MTAIVIGLLAALVLELYFADRALSRVQSKFFIERQQLQSKVDALTEHILQQSGHPIDLNKSARDSFKKSLNDVHIPRPFSGVGWKMDKPATPPKSEKEN